MVTDPTNLTAPDAAPWAARWFHYRQKKVRELLRSETGKAGSVPLIPSGTYVDTGLWWRQSRVWLAPLKDRWILIAAGPRPFIQTTPVATIRRSGYNPITGCIWFDASPTPALSSLEIAAVTARQLISTSQPPKQSAYA